MNPKPKIVPLNASREFFINELFFSTTTQKGIILSGNDVFARVSNYRLEEMIGKPHNLIRHPDMPHAIFKLLWDYLLAGKSIAAYVKNLASDGRYYWVVALVAPIEEGSYLSVRFKPSSPLLGLISDIYSELRAIEQRHGEKGDGLKAGMLAAEARLSELLQINGFADYDAFMQAFLYQELSSRDGILLREGHSLFPPLPPQHPDEGQLGSVLRTLYHDFQSLYQQTNSLYARFDESVKRNEELGRRSGEVLALTHEFQHICLNLTVASSRLSNAGHTLTAISAHLREASSNVAAIVSGLATQATKISACLGETVFGWAWARLQFEMMILDLQEFLAKLINRDDTMRPTAHLQRLVDLRDAFSKTIDLVERSLQQLANELKGLTVEVGELRKALLSLQVTYVGGLVEAARLSESSFFTTIFHEVHKHIEETKVKLGTFSQIIRCLDSLAHETPKIKQFASRAKDQIKRDQERLAAIINQRASTPGPLTPSLEGQGKQSSKTEPAAA